MPLPRLFVTPSNATVEERHNWLATQKEALAFGPMDASAAFLPILLARLGATTVQVGLLTAIPGLAGFLLAVPYGHFLQGRRNAVPWYSRGRVFGQLSIAAIGLALFVVPIDQAVPVILAIVAISTLFGSFANLSFYVVMDGLAGRHGRYELMGRRWGMKGAATAVSLAVVGLILGRAPFPASYEVVFLATSAFALLAFRYARTFRIPDNPHVAVAGTTPVGQRFRAFLGELLEQRRFLAYLGRHTVLAFGFSMAVPLIPLYYVRELGATDGWIGLIGTVQATLTMAGYFLWRSPAKRRGGAWVLVPATLGMAAFPAILSVTHQDVVVAVFVGIWAFCLAGVELALFDELMKSVPAGKAVRFASFDSSASNFAAMTGPIVGALLAGIVGIPGGLVAASAVGLVGAGLFAASVSARRHAEREAVR